MANPLDATLTEWRAGLADAGEYDQLAEALLGEIRRHGALKARGAAVAARLPEIDRALVAAGKERKALLAERVELGAEEASLPGQLAESRRLVDAAHAAWRTEALRLTAEEERRIQAETAAMQAEFNDLHLELRRQDQLPYRMKLRGEELAAKLTRRGELELAIEPVKARLALIGRVRRELASGPAAEPWAA